MEGNIIISVGLFGHSGDNEVWETIAVLREVLDHRDKRGVCDSNYWKERFESLSYFDDAMLRSVFKKLKKVNMISIIWVDDYPYIINVLSHGDFYFEEKRINKYALVKLGFMKKMT